MLNPQNPSNCTPQPSSIWTQGLYRTNGNVGPYDFIDPQRLSGGHDSNMSTGFDRAGTGDAFAYYSGHGSDGPNQGTNPFCTSSTTCTTPPSSLPVSMPGVCPGFPPAANPVPQGCGYTQQYASRCSYAWTHKISICSSDPLKTVNYSNGLDPTWMALGESPNSGAWANAGTDGGVNVAVLSMSHPFEPGSEITDASLFAGLHILLGVGSHRLGDTGGGSATRGAWFAYGYAAFGQNQVVRQAWQNVVTYLLLYPDNTQGCCAATGSNQDGVHPGSGINGCGSHVAISRGATQTEANNLNAQTWIQVTDNSTDAKGAAPGIITVNRFCNYSCSTYPPVRP
jgi:hypothetical protein